MDIFLDILLKPPQPITGLFLVFRFCIPENHQWSGQSPVDESSAREIFIIVDGLAGHLSFKNAQILFLSDNEGYHHLAQKLESGSLSVRGFKIVNLLVGRGDVWETDNQFFKGVDAVIQEVKNQNERAILVLGATLPATNDSRPMVSSFTFRNDKLAVRCTADTRLEHA